MSYMKSTDSAVLEEFGRIMQEKEAMTKIAQAVAPLSEDDKAKLQRALAEFVKSPSNGPGMEKWINRLKGQTDPYLKSVHDALAQRYQLWAAGKDSKEVGAVALPGAPQPNNMATQPQPGAPVAAVPPARAALSTRQKTADGKAYDVTGKEDIVNEAHPGKAMVEGELVENLNQQQDADKAVAEKSAKNVLIALYKLAKRLKAEKNEKAYALVKETFLDLSKSFKK